MTSRILFLRSSSGEAFLLNHHGFLLGQSLNLCPSSAPPATNAPSPASSTHPSTPFRSTHYSISPPPSTHHLISPRSPSFWPLWSHSAHAQCASVGAASAEDRHEFHPGTSDSEENEDLELHDGRDEEQSTEDYLVVNFYVLVDVEDPHLEVTRHTTFMKDKDIHGRIYISSQGINAQYSGPQKDALAYVDWVKEDPRFSGLYAQVSPSFDGHTFPRLRLRYKPSLVQVQGGTSNLQITDHSVRAIPLTPKEWKEKLGSAQDLNLRGDYSTCMKDKSCSQQQRNILLLDVRNGYEWDIGHFKGAQRPEVDCFQSTAFGLQNRESDVSDPLANVDKANTDVLMYCTGGIRCDVYSALLRQRGFKHLYSLKGGVARYLIEETAENWVGNLFVFDSRLAVPPQAYKLGLHYARKGIEENSVRMDEVRMPVSQLGFGRCTLCNDLLSSIRHRNCANLDCNRLFLCCQGCAHDLKGCCSLQCTSASRLRPFFSNPQQYKRWFHYRETDQITPCGSVSRRAMKRSERREQRKQAESAISKPLTFQKG